MLGPTDPNRLMGISATIDPAGTHGGPVALDVGIPYPLPTTNSMPFQETTPNRPPVPS